MDPGISTAGTIQGVTHPGKSYGCPLQLLLNGYVIWLYLPTMIMSSIILNDQFDVPHKIPLGVLVSERNRDTEIIICFRCTIISGAADNYLVFFSTYDVLMSPGIIHGTL